MEADLISINGKIYEPGQALVSALDRGLIFGHGAFETFRSSNGGIFLFNEHFARLDKNLKALDIDWTYDENKHLVWINSLSSKIPDGQDGRIRFCVTSGVSDGQPDVIIYMTYIDKFKLIEKNARILQSIQRHKPEYFDSTGFRIKSLEYSYLYLAKKELKDDNSMGILLNPEGYIAEALTANIFWLRDNKLYTPPLSLGILAGTMRGWLMNNFEVEEKLARQDELLEADEIFLSAGASYLTAINKINDNQKPGINGSVYKSTCQFLKKHLSEKSVQT